MSGNKPPPRLQKTLSIKRDDKRSPIELLQQMGFSKERCEKAIAATGDRGVQLATDWLLSHVNDPHLDDQTPRQYTLYLCPVGPLKDQLQEYYDNTLSMCGWNGFHNYLPHITLCPLFSVPNNKVDVVKQAFKHLQPKLNLPPGKMTLDFFSKPNYIALFLGENYFKYFKDLVVQFAHEVKQKGIEVEATKNQLHISLAYQFAADHYEKLTQMAKKVDPKAECHWELRLYSRDHRFSKSEVRRVIKMYKGDLEDELDLIMEDYVFMDVNESAKSQDGWYKGTSWLTGQEGMFPGNFTVRTAETWAWAMHGSLALGEEATGFSNGVAEGGMMYESLWNPEDMYAKVNKKPKSPEAKRKPKSPEAKRKASPRPRHLYVMRHGERMDFVFGRDWCDKCFDNDGNYKPTDLNMPKSIPPRNSYYLDYCKDAPLTTLGNFQSFLTGEAFKEAGVIFQHVYVSPSMRCVQTATAVLKAMGISPIMRVEPGLFEWLGWYQLGLPKFFTPAELKAHGFNVDLSYTALVPIQKFNMDEDIAGYYKRSGDTAKQIVRRHHDEGGNILIVGHAGSLEVCTRELLGHRIRPDQQFRDICGKMPYCATLACKEDISTRKWTVNSNQIPSLSHGTQKNSNARILLYPS